MDLDTSLRAFAAAYFQLDPTDIAKVDASAKPVGVKATLHNGDEYVYHSQFATIVETLTDIATTYS